MTPILLFAHGAGAGHEHPWNQTWFLHLSTLGETTAFTFPYRRQAGRRPPDPMPTLEAALIEAAATLAHQYPDRPLILAGKSMGGRVAARVAAQTAARAVIVLGYPLMSSGKTPVSRADTLHDMSLPTLLVQGSRDDKAPLAHVEEVVATNPSWLRLRMVPDGDHSLLVPRRAQKQAGTTQEQVDLNILADIRRFLVEFDLLPPDEA